MARTLCISPFVHTPLSSRCDPRQGDGNAFSFLRFTKLPAGSSLFPHHLRHRRRAEAPFSSFGQGLGSRSSDSSPVDLIVNEGDEEAETSVSPSGSVTPGGDGFFIKIEKSGRNRRRVRARVRIETSLEAVWDVLTDYERLVDFIPGLAVCRLIERSGGFVRMFQAEESHSSSFPRTFLSYIVDVEPKLWLPVSLVEKRLCNEIELNLLSIRGEVQKRSATDALSDFS